jgi:hypothetical protein
MRPEFLTEQQVTDRLNPMASRPKPDKLELSAVAALPLWEGILMVSLRTFVQFSFELFVLLTQPVDCQTVG